MTAKYAVDDYVKVQGDFYDAHQLRNHTFRVVEVGESEPNAWGESKVFYYLGDRVTGRRIPQRVSEEFLVRAPKFKIGDDVTAIKNGAWGKTSMKVIEAHPATGYVRASHPKYGIGGFYKGEVEFTVNVPSTVESDKVEKIEVVLDGSLVKRMVRAVEFASANNLTSVTINHGGVEFTVETSTRGTNVVIEVNPDGSYK